MLTDVATDVRDVHMSHRKLITCFFHFRADWTISDLFLIMALKHEVSSVSEVKNTRKIVMLNTEIFLIVDRKVTGCYLVTKKNIDCLRGVHVARCSVLFFV